MSFTTFEGRSVLDLDRHTTHVRFVNRVDNEIN